MDKELLVKYGIDYERGLGNCMGDGDFFQTLLSMFLQDDCFPRAEKAFANKDYKELFNCMHELKGVSGNAALADLYSAIVPLVETLRSGNGAEKEAQIGPLFAEAERAYRHTCDGISQAIGQ